MDGPCQATSQNVPELSPCYFTPLSCSPLYVLCLPPPSTPGFPCPIPSLNNCRRIFNLAVNAAAPRPRCSTSSSPQNRPICPPPHLTASTLLPPPAASQAACLSPNQTKQGLTCSPANCPMGNGHPVAYGQKVTM